MKNMMDIVNNVVSGKTLDKVSDLIGAEKEATRSAISKFAPAILGGLIGKSNTTAGSQSLLDLFEKENYGVAQVSNINNNLDNTENTASYLNDGMGILDMIFGKNLDSVLDKLTNLSSIGRTSGSTLLKFLAPLIINNLADMTSKNRWDAYGLKDYLQGQRSEVDRLVPGMAGLVGYAETADTTSTPKQGVKVVTKRTVVDDTPRDPVEEDSDMNWLKWLIPILIIGALWILVKGCGDEKDVKVIDDGTTKVEEVDNTSSKKLNDRNTTSSDVRQVESVVDYNDYEVTPEGDIVDSDRNVLFRRGTYDFDERGNLIDNHGRILIHVNKLPTKLNTSLRSQLGKYAGTKLVIDDNGNLVDSNGKVIIRKGEFDAKEGYFYDKRGNRLGRIWEDIVDNVGDATVKTVDGMRKFFSDMFKGKEVTNSYLLTQIKFDKENHRITDFSKAEVEGLAAALKGDEKSSIDVNVYTQDGTDAAESKKLSKIRAEVVRDMLTTLGVKDSQIGYHGKGRADARKAEDDRVEIIVRK